MYAPGFGDAETWGPYAGHPNDPRAPEPPDWWIEEQQEGSEE